MKVVDLEIILLDMPYPVTRRLRLPLAVKLSDLHKLLQAAMPWDNSHLYDFTLGRSLRWTPEAAGDWEFSHDSRKETLGDLLAQKGRQRSFTYTYDMGDSWEHQITPGTPRDLAEGETAIALLAAKGACPPDDSGGAPGFDYMLMATSDPDHDEHDDLVEWLGDQHPWNPVADQARLAADVQKVAARLIKAR